MIQFIIYHVSVISCNPFSMKQHGAPALEAQTMATSFDAFAMLIAVAQHYARRGGLGPRQAVAAGYISVQNGRENSGAFIQDPYHIIFVVFCSQKNHGHAILNNKV